MKALPDVTLVCVDNRTPGLAVRAMQRCQARLKFAQALLFTDAGAIAGLPAGITGVAVQIDGIAHYSRFMLRGLLPHIHTSHLLVVQWDGWVTQPHHWQDDWLAWDYIGPPWVDAPAGCEVGNGGFSLRSRRLLQALMDPAIEPQHPEDRCICVTHRQRLQQVHGLRFAPLDVARRFGFEHEVADPQASFGFHGLFNLHRALDDAELADWIAALPATTCAGLPGRMLWRELVQQRRLHAARHLLQRAAPAMPWRRRARAQARLWLAGLRPWSGGAR